MLFPWVFVWSEPTESQMHFAGSTVMLPHTSTIIIPWYFNTEIIMLTTPLIIINHYFYIYIINNFILNVILIDFFIPLFLLLLLFQHILVLVNDFDFLFYLFFFFWLSYSIIKISSDNGLNILVFIFKIFHKNQWISKIIFFKFLLTIELISSFYKYFGKI